MKVFLRVGLRELMGKRKREFEHNLLCWPGSINSQPRKIVFDKIELKQNVADDCLSSGTDFIQ
jgi:hypothetical protein